MSQITTHILDIARGSPAVGVAITLYHQQGESWTEVGTGHTNQDGRIPDLCPEEQILEAGVYRMHFVTQGYFQAIDNPVFYPWADVVFQIEGNGQHYHIPLLLSPYGYSTYRGS